jgi:hypothetical protein
VFLGDHQRPCDQGRQQLEYRVAIDPVPAADLLGGLQRATAGEYS